jgi:AcrR family transcriptional regulator
MGKVKASPPPTAAMGRVAQRRARVRAALLAAARQVFATRGYHDATISEIIQTADVAIGTFYLHFREKEELLDALAEEGLGTLREQIHATIDQHPDEPLLPLVIRTLLQTAYEQRDLFALIDAGESSILAQKHTHRAQAGLAEHFIPLFQAAGQTGQLGAPDPTLMAHLLVGLLMRAITWWFARDEPDPEEMAKQILSVLRHGLPACLFTERESHPFP